MRIKLKEFDHYTKVSDLKVRITDLNYGNHLSNEMMLSYAQQARIDLLEKLGGWGELTLAGVGIIMTDAAVVYKAEAHVGDELEIGIVIDDLTRVGFDIYYKITNKANKKVIAQVKTGIVCFDYEKRKVTPVPAVVQKAIEQL